MLLTPRATAPSRRSWISAEEGISGLDVVHDVLDPGVVLETVHGEVLPVAGVFEPAVRHLRHDRDVRVDPYAAEVEPPHHPHRAAVVTGPDRGRQTVLHAVGPAD